MKTYICNSCEDNVCVVCCKTNKPHNCPLNLTNFEWFITLKPVKKDKVAK